MNRKYEIVRNLPVAKFYYQGSHSHPVRRTILVIQSNSRYIRGIELRNGSEIRNFKDAPVKTYTKSKIAKIGQCGRRLRRRTPSSLHNQTTYTRKRLMHLITAGI